MWVWPNIKPTLCWRLVVAGINEHHCKHARADNVCVLWVKMRTNIFLRENDCDWDPVIILDHPDSNQEWKNGTVNRLRMKITRIFCFFSVKMIGTMLCRANLVSCSLKHMNLLCGRIYYWRHLPSNNTHTHTHLSSINTHIIQQNTFISTMRDLDLFSNTNIH